MGVLDSIVKKVLFEGPETVSTTLYSASADISGIEESLAIMVTWLNGSGSPDVDISLDVSLDDVNWVNITETLSNSTDVSGLGIFDVATTGVTYIRVRIEVNSGQIDVGNIILSGKRQH